MENSSFTTCVFPAESGVSSANQPLEGDPLMISGNDYPIKQEPIEEVPIKEEPIDYDQDYGYPIKEEPDEYADPTSIVIKQEDISGSPPELSRVAQISRPQVPPVSNQSNHQPDFKQSIQPVVQPNLQQNLQPLNTPQRPQVSTTQPQQTLQQNVQPMPVLNSPLPFIISQNGIQQLVQPISSQPNSMPAGQPGMNMLPLQPLQPSGLPQSLQHLPMLISNSGLQPGIPIVTNGNGLLPQNPIVMNPFNMSQPNFPNLPLHPVPQSALNTLSSKSKPPISVIRSNEPKYPVRTFSLRRLPIEHLKKLPSKLKILNHLKPLKNEHVKDKTASKPQTVIDLTSATLPNETVKEKPPVVADSAAAATENDLASSESPKYEPLKDEIWVESTTKKVDDSKAKTIVSFCFQRVPDLQSNAREVLISDC